MKASSKWLYLIPAAACGFLALVDLCWQPGYWIRSAVKAALFGGAVGLSGLVAGAPALPRWLLSRKSLKGALLLGAGIFGVIWLAFFLCRGFIDLQSIAAGLLTAQNVRSDNFLWVALYISTVNSFLEELFFRGFAYLGLRQHWGERPAASFSAALFALYHVSIIGTWFSWWVFGLCMLGLFLGGLIFCALDREGSILPSWLAHGAANLAINTIGLLMFRGF